MFSDRTKDYIYSPLHMENPEGDNLYFPIEADTEYEHAKQDINNPLTKLCKTITAQCRSIYQEEGLIYAHPDIESVARHKVFQHGFVGVDYLEDNGHKVKLTRLPSWETVTNTPWIQIDIYTFFAVAEIMRIFQGVYRNDVKSLITNPTNFGIEQGRRLRTYTKVGNQLFNWCEMPWNLTIDGIDHRVRLCIYDTCAVHGVASYASFCENSRVTLDYKHNFNSDEKSRMLEMYINRPDDFDDYALGDLHNYDALLGNSENFQEIYKTLNLEPYFTPPRFTIGATVSRIFNAAIKNLFDTDVDNNAVINAFCQRSSADWLKRNTTTTACLNAKVDGGRCRNNRPTDTTVSGVICDIDISSCYGEGLRIQEYPLGIPMVIDYPIKSKNNNYDTLKKFLTRYGKELVPGLWQARVSTKDGYVLKYAQDYLVSWFPPKDISSMPSDEEFAGTDNWWDVDNLGETKILNNEVHHAVITHDFIQWLDNVASVRQRAELLNNLIVETAMFYPASKRVESPIDLEHAHLVHKGKNTTKATNTNGRLRKISIEEDCYAWYGVNLGHLLVDKLLLERKKHPKGSSFNTLYKLCVNTVYGDMVSPFFKISNVIVGNNITARARALAWCMEKGFHGFQTITDGCAFDLNRVVFPRQGRGISGEMSVNLYAELDNKSHIFAPLRDSFDLSVTDKLIKFEMGYVGDKAALVYDNGTIIKLSPNDSLDWVNGAAMRHLQSLFSNLDILHQPTVDVYGNPRTGQFSFEAKGFYDLATFHGSANYMLCFQDKSKFAMRSYSKKQQTTFTMSDELEAHCNDSKVAETFLTLLVKPGFLPRSQVHLKERILKCGDYQRNYRKWENTEVFPGITIETAGLLHEFSLSQFTFKTYKQLISWRREHERLLRNYDQSYEMYFLREDGSLDYQTMVETIDLKIRSGKTHFFEGVDKCKANAYRKQQHHCQSATLAAVQEKLNERYFGEQP